MKGISRLQVIVLAQGGALPPTTPLSSPEKEIEIWSNDMALMVGLGMVALLVLAFFAKQAFSGKERRRKRVSESRSVPKVSALAEIESPRESKERRKRRKRKRSHRPSNPTLGETGGLPPKRGGG